MLKLTRRIGEVIIIGDDITLQVLGINNGKVRLGIGAAKSVVILRKELYQKDSCQTIASSEPIDPSKQSSANHIDTDKARPKITMKKSRAVKVEA